MTATDEPSFLYDPHGLWESLAKHLYGGTCDYRTKGGTMDLIGEDNTGKVYVCRRCGYLMRLGYIVGGR